MAARRPFWKWHIWKFIGFGPWPQATCIWTLKLKFQSKLELRSGNHAKKSNMAARQPFWKWHCWKSIGFFPYTQVMCQWSLDLIFKAKLKLESANRKIQYVGQAAILKVTSLKIYRLLAIAIYNMHTKFEIEIPRHIRVTLQKPCRLQTYGQTDRRTRWIQYTPPPTSLGRGMIIFYYCIVGADSLVSIIDQVIQFTALFAKWVSEWLDLTAFLGTADSEVHIVHISCVITAYTLESLSSLT